MSDERVTIYTAQDAPACPDCGAPLVLVKARAGGRTWPALCCRQCEYWRMARPGDNLTKPNRRGRSDGETGAEK